jgi:activator of 2-hydroxyglutaryl-CoA dehydratase
MAVVGIDLGSQNTKAVILQGDEILGACGAAKKLDKVPLHEIDELPRSTSTASRNQGITSPKGRPT